MSNRLKDALIKYLDCPCQFFEPMADDAPVMRAYRQAAKRGKEEGFTPVLVTVDKTLWECLIMNSDKGNNMNKEYEFSTAKVAEYRKKMQNNTVKTGKEVLADLLKTCREYAEEDGFDWKEDILGEVADGGLMTRFAGYWNLSVGNGAICVVSGCGGRSRCQCWHAGRQPDKIHSMVFLVGLIRNSWDKPKLDCKSCL